MTKLNAPPSPPHILIVDDEPSIREVLEIFFEQRGCKVTSCEDGAQAEVALNEGRFTLILTDLRLPKGGGMRVLDVARETQPSSPVVMMTAYSSTTTAIEAMKRGAYDYLIKPFELEALDVISHKAIEHAALILENAKLKAELSERSASSLHGIIGRSDSMRAVLNLIERVAPSKTPILILGESGTGKEMVAQAIHQLSPRAQGPFVVINCAAIPEHLFESELFGHVRGAFTGALEQRTGLFQAADGGTLFLDEIGEMPLAMQAKVLRALQFRRVKAVGATEEVSVDIRVLAATNRALSEDVQAGLFREDLYYRLNVIPIELPPLRERSADIPILVEHFVQTLSQEQGREPPSIEPSVMTQLLSAPLHGNVRELKNLVERAFALSRGATLSEADFMLEELNLARVGASPSGSTSPPAIQPEVDSSPIALRAALPLNKRQLCERLVALIAEEAREAEPELKPLDWGLDQHLELVEEVFLRCALKQSDGNRTEAARLLGISFRSMRYRLKKLKISQDDT